MRAAAKLVEDEDDRGRSEPIPEGWAPWMPEGTDPAEVPSYDLDEDVYNRHTAWWSRPTSEVAVYWPSGWRATCHGAGADRNAMRRCGCRDCTDRVDWLEGRLVLTGQDEARPVPVAPEPHVDAGPARAHLEELLAAGWTKATIARRTGLSASSVTRLSWTATSSVMESTAEAVLAVAGPTPSR